MSFFSRNPLNHSPEFRRRRFLNWFPLGLTYATFYMGRYNFNVASSDIMETFHLSKAEIGTIATAGFWTYALSVILNGPLADRIGGKKAIIFGGIGTAAAQPGHRRSLFLAGWQTKIVVGMSLLYAVNKYFQSFGALSVVKVNAAWFHVQGARHLRRHLRHHDLQRLLPGDGLRRLDPGPFRLALGVHRPARR